MAMRDYEGLDEKVFMKIVGRKPLSFTKTALIACPRNIGMSLLKD